MLFEENATVTKKPGNRRRIRVIFKVCPVEITAFWKPKNNCLVVRMSQVSASPGLVSEH